MNLFLRDEEKYYESADDVQSEYPDAFVIMRVEGGWMLFPTMTDYDAWHDQVYCPFRNRLDA